MGSRGLGVTLTVQLNHSGPAHIPRPLSLVPGLINHLQHSLPTKVVKSMAKFVSAAHTCLGSYFWSYILSYAVIETRAQSHEVLPSRRHSQKTQLVLKRLCWLVLVDSSRECPCYLQVWTACKWKNSYEKHTIHNTLSAVQS